MILIHVVHYAILSFLIIRSVAFKHLLPSETLIADVFRANLYKPQSTNSDKKCVPLIAIVMSDKTKYYNQEISLFTNEKLLFFIIL